MLSTRGIMLKVVKYGETSIICDIYTEAVGRQSYIINGVRKKNARYPASLFQPMYIVQIEAYDNPQKELNRIKEIKAAVGQFALELLRKSVSERETNQELFDYVFDFFMYLDSAQEDYMNCHLWFAVHLTQYLGFMPSGNCNDKTPYFDIEKGSFVSIRGNFLQLEDWISSDIFGLMHLDLASNHQINLTSTTRNKLIEEIVRFYQMHIDGMQAINSHQVLAQVFR